MVMGHQLPVARLISPLNRLWRRIRVSGKDHGFVISVISGTARTVSNP
jgi:hypothetical protein